MRENDPIIGTLLTTRNLLLGELLFFAACLISLGGSQAQVAFAAFFAAVCIYQFVLSRRQLEALSITRTHRPRVFEGDSVKVTLKCITRRSIPIQMLQIEDQFFASLDIAQRNLIPWLVAGWQVRLPYMWSAERHHGLYLIGPIQVRTADGLGIFFQYAEIGTMSRLIVYPKVDALPDYRIPGLQAQPGSSLDLLPRVGQGDEILGIREYRRGDAPRRIHWRTSVRRGRLHTLQLNRPIQSELAVFVDMTRKARYGLGVESSARLAISAAISILTRGYEARHRLSLGIVQHELFSLSAGAGLAHLHLMLDRLVLLSPAGEADFWSLVIPQASLRKPGSRVVFIVTVARTSTGMLESLRKLTQTGIGVDCVFIDERDLIKIYRDQETHGRRPADEIHSKVTALRLSGARIFLLSREQQQLEVQIVHEKMNQDLEHYRLTGKE